MLYPVILAGGSGTRLWPVSTKSNPKQIRAIIDDQTLLQATYQRLLHGFDSANIFLATRKDLFDSIKQQIAIDPENIIVEARAAGTAMAIGRAALKINQRDPESYLAIVSSDHYVPDADRYVATIKQAAELAESKSIDMMLVGIKPTFPEVGYGYIEVGEEQGHNLHKVSSFKEKPDFATAQAYIEDGKHLWNQGLFIFKVAKLFDLYKKYAPKYYEALMKIKDSPDQEEKILDQIDNLSIDYALIEKLENMSVYSADFAWADIGDWRNLKKIRSGKDEHKNIVNTDQHVSLDSRGNLLYSFSDKIIATVGVENMILVETEEAILLTTMDKAHEIKSLLKKMEDSEEFKKYL